MGTNMNGPTSRAFAPFADQKAVYSKTTVSDAVQGFLNIDQIREVVKKNVATINDKELHGFTALHKAALRGDPKVTQILLDHGAAIDEPNNYGETPLHYACKQGNPHNIYIFIKNGGNIHTRDNQGRTCIHHAAIGGSVAALHYLSEVHRLQFDTRDNSGLTTLHLACYQGFQDAVKYLLRKGRTSPHWKDLNGNLPLHHACMNGLTETCWSLTVVGGCGTIHVRNKEGKAPMDILAEGKTLGHQYLLREMKKWAEIKKPNSPPPGPNSTYNFMLFLPFVSFLNALVIGRFTKAYGGFFTSFLTAWVAFYVSTQGHRLPHMCKWPNPVYAGAFAAGIIHTTIAYFYKLFPYILFSLLLMYSFYPNVAITSVLLGLVFLFVYVSLLVRDPGQCTSSRESGDSRKVYLDIEDVAAGRCNRNLFCVVCEIIKPERVKHCNICNKCFKNHDHHCLFLLQCVAGRNHRNFVIFLMLAVVMHTLFVAQAVKFLILVYPVSLTYLEYFSTLFFRQAWINTLVLMNFFSAIWEISVIAYNLSMISGGVSMSYRQAGWQSNYTLKLSDRIRNIKNFFMGRPTFTAYELYHTERV